MSAVSQRCRQGCHPSREANLVSTVQAEPRLPTLTGQGSQMDGFPIYPISYHFRLCFRRHTGQATSHLSTASRRGLILFGGRGHPVSPGSIWSTATPIIPLIRVPVKLMRINISIIFQIHTLLVC